MSNRKPDPEKTKAAKAAIAARLAAQTIVIDAQWRVVHISEECWEIKFEGKFYGYYGRLVDALQALPHKMLDCEARGTLALVLNDARAIHATIESAVNRAKLVA